MGIILPLSVELKYINMKAFSREPSTMSMIKVFAVTELELST